MAIAAACQVGESRSSTATIRSPARTPARSATLPGVTPPTSGAAACMPTMKIIQ